MWFFGFSHIRYSLILLSVPKVFALNEHSDGTPFIITFFSFYNVIRTITPFTLENGIQALLGNFDYNNEEASIDFTFKFDSENTTTEYPYLSVVYAEMLTKKITNELSPKSKSKSSKFDVVSDLEYLSITYKGLSEDLIKFIDFLSKFISEEPPKRLMMKAVDSLKEEGKLKNFILNKEIPKKLIIDRAKDEGKEKAGEDEEKEEEKEKEDENNVNYDSLNNKDVFQNLDYNLYHKKLCEFHSNFITPSRIKIILVDRFTNEEAKKKVSKFSIIKNTSDSIPLPVMNYSLGFPDSYQNSIIFAKSLDGEKSIYICISIPIDFYLKTSLLFEYLIESLKETNFDVLKEIIETDISLFTILKAQMGNSVLLKFHFSSKTEFSDRNLELIPSFLKEFKKIFKGLLEIKKLDETILEQAKKKVKQALSREKDYPYDFCFFHSQVFKWFSNLKDIQQAGTFSDFSIEKFKEIVEIGLDSNKWLTMVVTSNLPKTFVQAHKGAQFSKPIKIEK